MSDKDLIDEISELDEIGELEEMTLEEVKANLPKVFMNPTKDEPDVSFHFELETIDKVKVAKDRKTKVGTADMLILYSDPPVYCFRNAYLQLQQFVEKKNIKLPAILKFVTREGTDFNTKYIFEKV